MGSRGTAWRAGQREKGLCQQCSTGKALPGLTYCSVCREAQVQSSAASTQRRLAAGLCRDCSKPRDLKGPRCSDCLERLRNKYKYDVEHGICVHCASPATAGAFCLGHWFKNIGHAYGLNKKNGGLALIRQIWEEQQGLCAVTGRTLIPGVNASLDHITPLSKGGTHVKENLRWVLLKINHMKWDMTNEEFIESCREVVHASEKQTCEQATREELIKRSN